jgi:hypothetical protein
VGVVNLNHFEVLQGVGQGDTVALRATSDADLSDGLHVKAEQ